MRRLQCSVRFVAKGMSNLIHFTLPFLVETIKFKVLELKTDISSMEKEKKNIEGTQDGRECVKVQRKGCVVGCDN